MNTVYIYIMDTLADWEIGYITAELKSKRFFKKDAPEIQIKTVSITMDSITTMGGLTVIPDCVIDNIEMKDSSMLILPGSNTWNDAKNYPILDKAKDLLSLGGKVCAICGATVALANVGLLNDRPHTSNGVGFLDMFAPAYTGQKYYVDVPSIVDGNLITGACTGGILWTRQILESLDVFQQDTLEYWYQYFTTGKADQFYALMQSIA